MAEMRHDLRLMMHAFSGLLFTVFSSACHVLTLTLTSTSASTASVTGEDHFYSLHMAALYSQSSILELLLSSETAASTAHLGRGRDVDCLDSKKRTPLLVACEVGDLACVETLLAHRASLSVRDKTADGPLHKVARGGSQGNTYTAYFTDKSPFAPSSSEEGSEPSAKRHDTRDSATARHTTNKWQLAVLKYLLRKGTSSVQSLRLNGRNRQGETPLTLVCGRCSRDSGHSHSVVVLLTHAGADPHIVNAAGQV